MQSAQMASVIIVGRLTVAPERTLVTVEYEEKRKSQCTAPDKMLLFRVKIIVVASSVAALGRLKKEEEEERRKSDFRPIFTCSSRKLLHQCSFHF